jgi:hypothetical protein
MLVGIAIAAAFGVAAGMGGGLVLAERFDGASTSGGAGARNGAGAAADSAALHADSLAGADSAATDSAVQQVAAAQPTVKPPAPPADSGTRPAPAPAVRAIPPLVDVQAAVQTEARARLARVFATMEPKGAASVLEQMSDSEIVAILAPLNERQTAAILEQLSPQRAAAVSRALLNRRTTS